MKKVIPFVILVVLLVSVSLVVAQGGLPGAGWKSGQQIQNTGNAPAKVVFTAYDKFGNNYDCGEKNVNPGASETFLTDVDCTTVPEGFVGSAVVGADQPIAAIVNVTNRGTGLASAQYQGTDGADVANNVSFPLVKRCHSGRTTTFYVQNASTSENDITATFTVGGAPYTKNYDNVPGNAMVVVMPADAGVPCAQGTGSLEVSGTGPLAGAALEHEESAAVASNLSASKAFIDTDGAQNVFCPLYRKAQTAKRDQTSGVQVQNISGGPVNVDFNFIDSNGTPYGPFSINNLADGASHTFYAKAAELASIPDGSVGSATISATGNVVAVVNDAAVDGTIQRKATYACFGSGSQTVNVPLAKEFAGGNTTGVQVQNVGGSPAKVQLEYKATNGSTLKIESVNTVAPGESITAYNVASLGSEWTQLSGSGSMAGTVNGVVATSAQNIVVVANESSAGATPSNQDTKNYEGFGQ
ncbi:MAG: hypothetical protein R3293_10115 [Candidatus Promineifilaceae bacterium]|nr:hypothetical protein [Candidatus Promineifilaceae bacterium]